ncbi:UNVERIFIED_CONTAM: F-box protein At-B [Sesamum angustifolium]|uniref:F-box protein At-B n=1 Tax=Sesamum angustifolium TaxID=2727405 RepID=A0AAW2KW93_9LAMI
MTDCNKRPRGETATALPETSGGAPPQEGFPLPDTLIHSEILRRLELESLCSLACVSRALRSLVTQALSTLPSLDLSAFSPNGELLHRIVPRLRGAKTVTIDCLHLDDCSVVSVLGPHIQELNLLKCASLSYDVLASIGEKCPNLRILVLELAGESSPEIFRRNLIKMLKKFLYLEVKCFHTACLFSATIFTKLSLAVNLANPSLLQHLSIKVRGTEGDAYDLACIDVVLPKTLRFLKLQPVNEQDAILFVEKLGYEREIPSKLVNSSINSSLGFSGFALQRLSLVLNLISDRLVASIMGSLPLLVELDLEDRPCTEPKLPHDLTNIGLQFLGSFQHLTHLSIVRSRQNYPVSFKRINDLGLLLLCESCRALESVRLGGFSKVTDAGFSSLLRSCYNLKKFEIRNAPLLSDLAFHNIVGVVSPLVELKLNSCNLITSEAVAELASSSTLEVLDTYSCRSIADNCLVYISFLSRLTSLNLGGADITDSGLSVLSKSDLPITNLCLRGCTRVTDRGIICLLNSGVRIKKTLSSLDVGHMPGISDRAIHAIISSGEAITELCMRYCFHVTDNSLKTLASGRYTGSSLLQKLDICHCLRFSAGVVELLERPLFRGLRWLGVGGTSLTKRADVSGICRMRPWLTICFEGCELGCHDGWQYHKYNDVN